MVVLHSDEHEIRIDRVILVQRYEDWRLRTDTLKLIEVVSECGPLRLGTEPPVVPARPCSSVPRHQSRVAMEDGAVGLIPDRTEYVSFYAAWIRQQLQRLIAVGGDDDMVE